MTYQCSHCGIMSPDGNLWCQRVECSRKNLIPLIRRGECLDTIEIGAIRRVTRTATYYDARRNETEYLIKVAHDNRQVQYGEYLKEEAKHFYALDQLRDKTRHAEAIPKIVAPYHNQPIDPQRPYGRVIFRDRLLYYILFEHIEGKFLHDVLDDNPQPPAQYAAWIMIRTMGLLKFINERLQIIHMGLTPESILIRIDHEGYWRPVLMDLGLNYTLTNLYPNPQEYAPEVYPQVYEDWLSKYLPVAYTAPELFPANAVNPGLWTDVYNVSLLLYEMLMGYPTFEYETRTDKMVRKSVMDGRRKRLNRGDLDMKLTTIIEQGLATNADVRPNSLTEVSETLKGVFDDFPVENPERRWYQFTPRQRITAGLIVLAILLIIAGIALAPVIGDAFSAQ